VSGVNAVNRILYWTHTYKNENGSCNFRLDSHTRQFSWLRYYAASWKAAGSIPGEVTFFFSIYLILSSALWRWGLLSL
jgi:hypothetical protein